MNAHSPAGAAYTAGLPTEIDISPGGEEHIALRSAVGAGYMWEATQISGSGEVASVHIELGPPPRQNDPPTNLPAPVMLIIGGRQPGQARWRLRLVRQWGTRDVLAEHEFITKVSR